MKLQDRNEDLNQKDVPAFETKDKSISSLTEKDKGKPDDVDHPERSKFIFFIEKQKFETNQEQLQVRQIMALANVDENTKTLAVKQQGGFHEYKDPSEVIAFKSTLHFVLFDNQPTPVS